MKNFIIFLALVFFPYLLLGITVGLFFGAVGYYGSIWMSIHETQRQNELVFWLFAAMGLLGGLYYSLYSLLAYIKYSKSKDKA